MAANALCHFKDSFKGRVKLIFQPAEEGAGAAAMIQDGVLESPAVDAIFAYHNYPTLPVGLENGQIIAVTEINGGSSKNITPHYVILSGILRYITILGKV